MKKKKLLLGLVTLSSAFVLAACGANANSGNTNSDSTAQAEKPADAPDTWIADRTITGLVFQSAGDVGADTMSPEIQEYIKERTGITLELQGVTNEDSTEALAAGLSAGDLPDFVAYYLNNSGRPEFPLLLQASNEGMFHDLAPMLQESETYSKYYEEGFLPTDTRENIMMREDQDGATYMVHMSINEEPADPGRREVGGMYIRKDIVEDLGIDANSIDTSEKLHDLLVDIKEGGYTDDNNNAVTPLGPTVWGGSERSWPYNDMVWEGDGGQKFWKDGDQVKHESQTDFAEQRVEYVQNLLDEGLMHPEFYTMEENRAKEGVVNGSFAIVSDMYNYSPENSDGEYIPLGPINRVDGNNHMVMPYKSGYAGWSVPSTTENPEEIVAFADWLAGPEGKMLYMYGLEGVHYDLDEDGNPVVKPELIELKENDPEAAKKEGFRGVGAYWGEHLAYTNMNNDEQFGEASWGQNYTESQGTSSTAEELADLANFDERYENKEVIDGLYPLSYTYEFTDGDETDLTEALAAWDEAVVRAYYAEDMTEAKEILDDARMDLNDADIAGFSDFLEQKEAEGDTIYY